MKAFMTGLSLITVSAVLLFTGTDRVGADVIFEPEDHFYESHSASCENNNRSYTADGPDGEVILYESPQSEKENGRLENGSEVQILFTYTDSRGIEWGVCETEEEEGWIPMDYLDLIYDGISFAEDHQADIRAEEGTVEPSEEGNVIFYQYPGGRDSYEMPVETGYEPAYEQTYTDSQGRTWGSCSYYMGIKGYWICLDAPDASYEELYPDGPREEQTQTSGEENSQINDTESGEAEEIITPDNSEEKKIALIAAAFILAISLLSICLLRRMKK